MKLCAKKTTHFYNYLVGSVDIPDIAELTFILTHYSLHCTLNIVIKWILTLQNERLCVILSF